MGVYFDCGRIRRKSCPGFNCKHTTRTFQTQSDYLNSPKLPKCIFHLCSPRCPHVLFSGKHSAVHFTPKNEPFCWLPVCDCQHPYLSAFWNCPHFGHVFVPFVVSIVCARRIYDMKCINLAIFLCYVNPRNIKKYGAWRCWISGV